MRACCLTMLTLAGCVGEANLGSERIVPELDGGLIVPGDGVLTSELDASASDAARGAASLAVQIRVETTTEACVPCFELTAEPAGALAPYAVEWEDGTRTSQRRVCPEPGELVVYSVSVREPSTGYVAKAHTQLLGRPISCVAGAPELLCLANRSFDRTPLPLPGSFGAVPWVTCGTTLGSNSPQLLDGTVAPSPLIPTGSDSSFLSLAANEQVSQQPCAPISAGQPHSFKLDLAALTTDVVSGTSAPALELWAGASLDCSRSQLLWASPTLNSEWVTYCVTFTPQTTFDNFTLRATAAGALPYPGRVYVDRLEPVATCP